MKNIVILFSGRGSNMEAIIKKAKFEKWPVFFSAAITDFPYAPGLKIARYYNINTIVISRKNYSLKAEFDIKLLRCINVFSPDVIVLAGFMQILNKDFIQYYNGKILNIHPSLLPSFPGLRTHHRALLAGVKTHGATVHFVTVNVDQGPIIEQVSVPVLLNDTENILALRVLLEEHRIYPKIIRLFIENKICLNTDKMRCDFIKNTNKSIF